MTKTHFGWLLAAALLSPLASAEEAQVRVTATLIKPTCITTIGEVGATSSEQKTYHLDFGSVSTLSYYGDRFGDEKRFRLFISGCDISPGAVTTTSPELDLHGEMSLEIQSGERYLLEMYMRNINENGITHYLSDYSAIWKPFEIVRGFRDLSVSLFRDSSTIVPYGAFSGSFSLVTTYE